MNRIREGLPDVANVLTDEELSQLDRATRAAIAAEEKQAAESKLLDVSQRVTAMLVVLPFLKRRVLAERLEAFEPPKRRTRYGVMYLRRADSGIFEYQIPTPKAVWDKVARNSKGNPVTMFTGSLHTRDIILAKTQLAPIVEALKNYFTKLEAGEVAEEPRFTFDAEPRGKRRKP